MKDHMKDVPAISGLEFHKEKGKQEMSMMQFNRGKQLSPGGGTCPGWGSRGRLPQGLTGEINLKHRTAKRRKVYSRLRDCGIFGEMSNRSFKLMHSSRQMERAERKLWWWPAGQSKTQARVRRHQQTPGFEQFHLNFTARSSFQKM